MSEWISVKEEEPKPYMEVIIYSKKLKMVTVATFDSACNDWDLGDHTFNHPFDAVSHWMPLPQPPKEKDDE